MGGDIKEKLYGNLDRGGIMIVGLRNNIWVRILDWRGKWEEINSKLNGKENIKSFDI